MYLLHAFREIAFIAGIRLYLACYSLGLTYGSGSILKESEMLRTPWCWVFALLVLG